MEISDTIFHLNKFSQMSQNNLAKNNTIEQTTQYDKKHQELRVYLVDIVPPSFSSDYIEDRLRELESLVTTYK
jgi:hypothetical protein